MASNGRGRHKNFASVHTTGGAKKRCAECSATETPQWRQGPAGPQTLCNACGVRYSRLQRRQRTGTKKRQPACHWADAAEHEEQLDVSDQDNTDHDSKEGVTIALHPLRGGSEEPLQSDDRLVTPEELQHLLQQAAAAAAAVPSMLQAAAAELLPCTAFASPSAGDLAWDVPSGSGVGFGGAAGGDLAAAAPLNLVGLSRLGQQPAESGALAVSLLLPDARPPIMGREVLQQLLPLLAPAQLATLRELCQQFDKMYKELIAAQAARDAVAKILVTKQEEARQADNAAKQAARALQQEAQKLSGGSSEASARPLRPGAAGTAAPGDHPHMHHLPGSSPRKCSSPKRARFQ